MKRHDLVWLDKEYCKQNEFLITKYTNDKVIMDWIHNNHPFIVTRQLDNAKDLTNIGFLLPLEEGKKRIGLSVNTKAISIHTGPIKLSDILLEIEKKWYKPLMELIDSFLNLELDLYIYGSSMWQYTIGKKYMTEHSDIDLLWKPTTSCQLQKGLEVLKAWMNKHTLKIDGEIEFPCESACSWKELLNDDENIIIKRLNKVSIESKYDFIHSLKSN